MSTSPFDGTMAQMTWEEIEQAGQEGQAVLWPVAVLEEHGPHLSIAVDIYIGYILSKLVQEQLAGKGIRSVIAPPNYWGINNVTAAFPGSFTLRKETFKALLYDTLACLKRWGFERVFMFDLHGDVNFRAALLQGISEARVGCGTRAKGIMHCGYARYAGLTGNEDYLLLLADDANPVSMAAFSPVRDIHAGSVETSFMLRYYPDEVNVQRAKSFAPTRLTSEEWKGWASGWSDARKVVPYGFNGDPASIDAPLAEEYMRAEAKAIAVVIENDLNGIYQAPQMVG